MTLEEVVRLAQEAGLANGDYVTAHPLARDVLKFAELVAATERAKYRGEIQRLTELANTAEKWRGIATARGGDGRTVQQVQDEARVEEREACAKLCDRHAMALDYAGTPYVRNRDCELAAKAIRARSTK